ncbi:MAG: hypothetical protein K9J30_14400 [Bacteroidales bacterium]|nr:hypothetical protein [Bacteroidales bacterium]
MDTNLKDRIIAIYMIIIGVINIVMWSFLILSGSVADFNEKPVAYLFHWSSEFMMAVLLIIAGYKVLNNHSCMHNYTMLALGFLVISIGGAFFHYLDNFELIIFAFSSLVTCITIIAIIVTYESLKDFIYLTLGISVYALINITGELIQPLNYAMISMAGPALLFLVVLTVSVLKKDVVFKYLDRKKSNDP